MQHEGQTWTEVADRGVATAGQWTLIGCALFGGTGIVYDMAGTRVNNPPNMRCLNRVNL